MVSCSVSFTPDIVQTEVRRHFNGNILNFLNRFMEGQGMSILDHSSSQLAGGEILLAKKDVHLKNA